MVRYFSNETLEFLNDLKKRNDRVWFQKNKSRYEEHVKEPFIAFISDVEPQLHKLSPNFVADPKPVGGSLFRIHRDVRFSKDKSPYKTHAGAHFQLGGKGVHGPGYYLHVEPGASYVAGGIWMPDTNALRMIRQSIADSPPTWKKAREVLSSDHERLVRPPQGFETSHPLIEDIKLKSFTGGVPLSDRQVLGQELMGVFIGGCKWLTPLMKFLAEAVAVPWR